MEVQENNTGNIMLYDVNKPINIVAQYLEDKNINNAGNIFIVWMCYILGNRKYFIGTTNTYKYFEVTYNKTKDEWYIDVYNKIDNICIKN